MSYLDQQKIKDSITSSYMPEMFSKNAAAQAAFYSSIVGDADKFREDSANIKYPIQVNIQSQTKYWINNDGVETPISKITIKDGSNVSVIANGTTYNIELRTVAFSNDSIDGKISGKLMQDMFEKSDGIKFNILMDNTLNPSAVNRDVIGSINILQKDLVTDYDSAKIVLQNNPVNFRINTSNKYDVSTPEYQRNPSDQQLRELVNHSNSENSSQLSIYANGDKATNYLSQKMFQKQLAPRRDTSQMSTKDGTFNSRANNSIKKDLFTEKDENYTFKIGDVILQIPPTHLTVTQLRSACDIDMIGFQPMNTANSLSRIVFKINAVFSGKAQIDGDLKRLVTQFKYCPLNIIHSFDLVSVLRSEDSLLESMAGTNTATVPYVPVTMDEYTIYTIEGHPDSLGATFQFSLFNYLPYFDGDTTESFKYEKVELDKNGNIVIVNKPSVKTTTHLEYAIHPYNFDIEYILDNRDKRFFRLNDVEYEEDELGSHATLYKLTTFQRNDMALVDETDMSGKIDLLCTGMSARYENKFAWMPIGGYSQALPQYIGPGTVTLSLNAKVDLSNNKLVSRLFKTYHELRAKDFNQIYDDRYFITSSLTNFLDANVISIADVAVTTLPNHPGYSDVNIIMKKSPYVSTVTESDKVAELDIYWGLQRVARTLETNDKLRTIIDQSLQDATADQYNKYGWIAKWAANSGKQEYINGIDEGFSDLINAASQTVLNNGTAKEIAAVKAFRIYLISGNGTSVKNLISFLESYRDFDTSTLTESMLNLSDKNNYSNSIFNGFTYGRGIKRFLYWGLYNSSDTNLMLKYRLFFIAFVNLPGAINMFNRNSEVARDIVFKAFYGSKFANTSLLPSSLSSTDKASLESDFNNVKDSIKALMNNMLKQYDFINYTVDQLNEEINAKSVLGQIGFGLDENTQGSVAGVNLTSVGTDKESVLSALKKIEKTITNSDVYGTSAQTTLDEKRGVLIAQKLSNSTSAQSKHLEVKKENITSGTVDASILAALQNTVAIQPPRSAHRYYPQCQSMVKLDPMLSVTVGSFYFNNLQFTNGQHIRNMMDKFKRSIDNSISPMFNTSAWNAIFPKGSKASEWQNKAYDERDPFWLMQAISYTSSKKDMSPTHLAFATNNKTEVQSPLINFATTTEQGDGQKLQNSATDRPFSGMSDWIFISKLNGSNNYGSTAIDQIRNRIAKKKVYSLADSGDGSKDATSIYATIHNKMYNDMGVLTGDPKAPTLQRRSDISTAAITNGQMFSDEKGLTQLLDVPTDQFSYYTNYMTATKSPSLLKPKNDNALATPTSPTSDANTQGNAITQKNVDLLTEALTAALTRNDGPLALVKRGGVSLRSDYISRYVGAILLNGASLNFSSREDVIKCANDGVISAMNVFVVKDRERAAFGQLQSYASVSPYNDATSYTYKYLTIHDGATQSLLLTTNTYNPQSGVISGPTPLLAQTIFDAMLLRLSLEELKAVSENKFSEKVKVRTGVTSGGKISGSLFWEAGDEGYKMASSLVTLAFPDINIKTKSTKDAIDSVITSVSNLEGSSGLFNIDGNLYVSAKMLSDMLRASMQEFVTSDLQKLTFDSKNLFNIDTVSEDTSQYLVSQFMNSMLPTIGLQNAFPTFKVYIIDQNLSDIRFHSMDNWYDFRLVKDLMIVKSKEDPLHMLRCRVVIDERFMTLTTTFQQRDSERKPVEAKMPEPSLSITNTEFDHNFYQGKVPLRVGMRICVKLGYHTDPRLLDTVFIGTITGLQGGMDKYIFDLEASGDGRELSAPATMSAQKISGLNYGEVITKLLRSNPSVYHLGRNYGTALEQFTRDHYLLYGFARLCWQNNTQTWKDINSLVLTGGDEKSPVSLRYIGATSGIGAALAPVAASSLAGIGAVAGGGYTAINTIKNMSSSGLNQQILFEAKDKINKELTAYSSSNNIFNIGAVLGGNRFDMAKAGGQVFKHFYEIYRYGHNPIDQNIWAVDIWQDKLTNIGSSVDINISSTMSLWDVLTDIKRIYPNYALDIKPYGGRSTLYFGPRDWLIMRTDDPVLAMTSQLEQTSNKQLKEVSGDYFKKLYDYDMFMEKGGNSFPSLSEFQRTHIASSLSNIVFNGIESTPNRGWNSVAVQVGTNTYDAVANAELHPSVIRTNVKTINWTNDGNIAQQYALGFLRDGVEKMYGGTLVLRGNPKIEPYDKIYVMDAINKMYGWVEVETVIHKFDHNFGYTTHITPNLVCSVNSDAYKTTSQIVRSMFTGEDIAKYSLGLLAGGVIGAGVAAGIGMLSGPLAVAASAISIGMFLYAGANSITSAWQGVTELFDKNIGRKDDQEILAMLHDLHSERILSEGMKSGLDYGFALNYLIKLYKVDNKGIKVKQMNSAFWESLKLSYQNTYRARAGWSLLGDFALETGREASFNIDAMKRLNNKLKALDETKGISPEEFEAKYEKGDIKAQKAIKNLIEQNINEIKVDALKSGVPDAKTTEMINGLNEQLNKINERIAKFEDGTTEFVKPNKDWIKDSGTGVKKASIKAGGAFVKLAALQLTLDAIESIPKYMETFMLSYMTKANCISISPLWHKNTLMLAGLDGWQKTNAYMHMKNMVINAKRAIENVDLAINYAIPTVSNPYGTDLADSTQDAAEKLRKQSKQSAKSARTNTLKAKAAYDKYYTKIDKLVSDYRNKINADCAKAILTTDKIMGMIDQESNWNVAADNNYGKGLGQIIAAVHMEEIKASARSMGIAAPTTVEQAQILLKTNADLNLDVSMKILVSAINSETKIADGGCGTLDTPIGNKGLFDRALAAYNGGNGWRKIVSDTNVTGKKTNAEHYKDYINKVNSAVSVYKGIIANPNSVTTVSLGNVLDTTNKYSNAITQSAIGLLKTLYKFGGKDPYTGYIDCSGLVTSVVKSSTGINLPGNANTIYKSNELRPVVGQETPVGALVFWAGTQKDKPGATHIGIYIGNGEFIHASSGNGMVVTDNLSKYNSSLGSGATYLGAKVLKQALSVGATSSY